MSGAIDRAAAVVESLLPVPKREALLVRRVMAGDEIIVQRLWFLAEQVYLVAGPHEPAAEVLHVDVAPGAGEHVTVCND